MIKPGHTVEPQEIQLQQKKSINCREEKMNRQDSVNKVNWITQKSQRQAYNKQNHLKNRQQMSFDNQLRIIKTCLQREINLIPTNQDLQRNENQNQVSREELKHITATRSQKSSCEKRQKISIVSKRPSLRKISNFISFKQTLQHQSAVNFLLKNDEKLFDNIDLDGKQNNREPQSKSNENEPRKKCIRISARRNGLHQICNN